LNSDITLPVASEKSGKERSGIDGNVTEGNAGIAGIMSRADLVMLSIRLGATSSARAPLMASSVTTIESVLIRSPLAVPDSLGIWPGVVAIALRAIWSFLSLAMLTATWTEVHFAPLRVPQDHGND
jgi:hypothetical protein